PVSRFVGVRQRRAMNRMTQAHRVKLVGVGAQGHLDVAQALAPSQLSKRHDAKLFGATHAAHSRIARIAIHDACETRPGDKLHNLREQRLADIHGSPPRVSTPGNYTRMRIRVSNRHQIKSAARPRYYWLSTKLTSA